MVVNRALPFSSRFMPDAAPIGCSEVFSKAGRSVFSAHSFSAAEGWRPSNVSWIGLSDRLRELFLLCFSPDINPQRRRLAEFTQVWKPNSQSWKRPKSESNAALKAKASAPDSLE